MQFGRAVYHSSSWWLSSLTSLPEGSAQRKAADEVIPALCCSIESRVSKRRSKIFMAVMSAREKKLREQSGPLYPGRGISLVRCLIELFGRLKPRCMSLFECESESG